MIANDTYKRLMEQLKLASHSLEKCDLFGIPLSKTECEVLITALKAFERKPVCEDSEEPENYSGEIIRCKDCERYHEDIGWCDEHSHFITPDGEPCLPFESYDWKMFSEDYYCADGKLRHEKK